MRRAIALVSAVICLLGLLVAIGIGAYVMRPLSKMVETTKEIARGQVAAAGARRALDEVGEPRSPSIRCSMRSTAHAASSRSSTGTSSIAWRIERASSSRRSSSANVGKSLGRANERFVLAAAAVNGAIYDWDITSETCLWTDGLTRVFGYRWMK